MDFKEGTGNGKGQRLIDDADPDKREKVFQDVHGELSSLPAAVAHLLLSARARTVSLLRTAG